MIFFIAVARHQTMATSREEMVYLGSKSMRTSSAMEWTSSPPALIARPTGVQKAGTMTNSLLGRQCSVHLWMAQHHWLSGRYQGPLPLSPQCLLLVHQPLVYTEFEEISQALLWYLVIAIVSHHNTGQFLCHHHSWFLPSNWYSAAPLLYTAYTLSWTTSWVLTCSSWVPSSPDTVASLMKLTGHEWALTAGW